MNEVWRDVPGYEGLYQVSDRGRVRNKYRRRLLRPRTSKTGYVHVTLSKDGKATTYLLHRLVASAFLPNTTNLPQVNHKNGKKQDNCVGNLEWCSAAENQQHRHHVLGQPGHPKGVTRIETGKTWAAVYLAAKELGIHRTSISMVCHGKREKAGGLRFKFL